MLRSLQRGELIPRLVLANQRRHKTGLSHLEGLEMRLLSNKDFAVTEMLYKSQFANRHRLATHLRVTPESWYGYMKPMIKSCFETETSYGAYDKKSGSLVGVSLCRLGTTELHLPDLSEFPLNVRQLEQIYLELDQAGLEEELGTCNYLDMLVICVAEGRDQKGLGKSLTEYCVKRARELDCEYAIGVCSSAFSKRILERAGGKVVREILYKDYVDPFTGDKVFEGIADPHRGLSLLLVKLRPSGNFCEETGQKSQYRLPFHSKLRPKISFFMKYCTCDPLGSA